jgi:predicted pyridoxine 5'-phosphate oxidase superfamily flavin-nucleotide-binding protein
VISPARWHAGEVALQRTVGADIQFAGLAGRIFRPLMAEPQRAFFEHLGFVIVGTVDQEKRVWATVVAGAPGFIHSPDPATLRLDAVLPSDDPATPGFDVGGAVALLGIDFGGRRRFRLNGKVVQRDDGHISIGAEQVFGNCPKYIHPRHYLGLDDARTPSAVATERMSGLDAEARELIAQADTFFVASYVDLDAGNRQVDVSHRGGPRGFVRVEADGSLSIPDFSGNSFFNTLGNLAINPMAGLVFIDFKSGDLLQLSGDTAIVLDSPDIARFEGAERLWRFHPRAIVRRRAAWLAGWADAAP